MPQAREQRLNAVPEFGVTEWSDLARLGGWAQRHAAGSMARMASCPVLAVLATPGDAPADWLAAGALLLDLELLARASGVWLAEFNQAVELPDLRARLAQCSGLSGHPQVLLGLGYGAEVPPLPRRPVDEMLLPDHSPAFSMH
jgi:hypothetical protein